MIEALEKLLIRLFNYMENGELPDKYDFVSNKVGSYFLIPNIGDEEYKDNISLEIHFYSLDINKIHSMKKVEEVDVILNNQVIDGFWFTHKNVWLLSPQDTEGKTHYILNYNVNTNYR